MRGVCRRAARSTGEMLLSGAPQCLFTAGRIHAFMMRRRRQPTRYDRLPAAQTLSKGPRTAVRFPPGGPSREETARGRSDVAHTNTYPKLHNAMWPGLVGKGPDSEPGIGLDEMLELTAA